MEGRGKKSFDLRESGLGGDVTRKRDLLEVAFTASDIGFKKECFEESTLLRNQGGGVGKREEKKFCIINEI